MQVDVAGKFREALRSLCPNWQNERFIVALSGGLDSTALLLLALSILLPVQITAAHLNHRLRGEAAEADQRFAAALAAGRGVDFITATEDVAALAETRGKGLEEAARQARYTFLENAAREAGANFILTAHHADDQLETVLMNFVRGAGAGGLAGIHPQRPLGQAAILRPLLTFTREELQAVLTDANQTWVEDATNRDPRYRRNALRLSIIPQLKTINPRLTEAVTRAVAVLRSEEDFWQIHLQSLLPQIIQSDDPTSNTITLSRSKLTALTQAEQRRLIYGAFLTIKTRTQTQTGEPISLSTIETVLTLLTHHPAHKGLDLPGGLRATLSLNELKLSPASRFI